MRSGECHSGCVERFTHHSITSPGYQRFEITFADDAGVHRHGPVVHSGFQLKRARGRALLNGQSTIGFEHSALPADELPLCLYGPATTILVTRSSLKLKGLTRSH